jgi:uncharacterized protein (DUF1684 family)
MLLLATPLLAQNAAQHEREVKDWRAGRIERLIGPTGWITLVGLFKLQQGENTFGRAAGNALLLDHPSMPPVLGSFTARGHHVTFTARPESKVTHKGQPVQAVTLPLNSDVILAFGTLEFFAIERAGELFVRVRDTEHPARRAFKGIDSYPINLKWKLDAKFEPYSPAKQIDIVNILGQTEAMVSPGAVVFSKDGKEHRLDAVLEEADAKELFIMFMDGTTIRETYGAGRYLYIPLPANGRVPLDFNRAYNPPCAFNDFATCPLPPSQNRLSIRVDAGEKKYVTPSK